MSLSRSRKEIHHAFLIKLLFSWSFNCRDWSTHFVVEKFYPIKEHIIAPICFSSLEGTVTSIIPFYFDNFDLVGEEIDRSILYVPVTF